MSSILNKYFFSKQGILLIIILVACFFSYIKISDYEFINWDDDTQITENTFVKNLNHENLIHNYKNERYTFLTLTSYSVIYKIWGNNPAPFHWLSIILHLLNVILVFQLSKQFSKNIFTICLVTLLFALHPMRVESVAWISEIKDLLYTFFSLIAFLFYFKYLQSNYKFYWFIIASIMIVFASYSKIQGVIVPVSFFLVDFYLNRKFSLGSILEKVILYLLIFVVFNWINLGLLLLFLFSLFILQNRINNINLNKAFKISVISLSVVGIFSLFILIYYLYFDKTVIWSDVSEFRNKFSSAERFLLSGFALGFYLKSFLFPFSLNAVHPYPQRMLDGSFPQIYYFTLIILFIVIGISVLLIIKRNKVPAQFFFGWFFFLVNISLVLHFIPIEGRLVVADRYSYFAYFGLFILLTSFLEKYLFDIKFFKKYLLVFLAFLLCILSYSTINRIKVWRNTKVLFTDVLHKNPDISFAYLNLAATFLNNQKPDSALICFNQSVKLDSLDPTAYFNRAFAFINMKSDANAIKDFYNVIRLSENKKFQALSYTNIGEIYRKTGKDSLAINFYNLAIEHDSLSAISYNNRGIYFLNKNMLKDAKRDFTKAVMLNIDYTEALNNLGWVLTLDGELERALYYFNRSLELDTNYSFAYDNRGYLKYVKRDNEGAISDFNKAISIEPGLSQAYINRGRTYASMKNYKNAINDFSYVLKIEPDNMIALTNRAYAWVYLNENKNAEEDFKLIITKYPNNAIAWQNIAWFHLQLKDFKNAITEFEESIEIDNTLINSYSNLGWIYIELNDYKKADKFLNLSLKLNPNNSESIFLLGELNRKNGNKESACKYYLSSSNLGNSQAKNALNLYCSSVIK